MTALILAVAVAAGGITAGVMWFVGSKGKEPLPQRIVVSRPSPDGEVTALLLYGHTGDSWDLLGAGHRYYLAIKRNEVTYIVDRDLTEGQGTYEGAVLDLKWLNGREVLIERIVEDRRNDLIFDITKHQWKTKTDQR